MEMAAVMRAWPELVASRLTPLTTGANNTVYLVYFSTSLL